VAKKTIRRTKYQLEDNVKRVQFIRPSQQTIIQQLQAEFAFATRDETDAGVLTTKALNPDVGAYAYDRLRWPNQHTAGKGTAAYTCTSVGGVIAIPCRQSNVFEVELTEDAVLSDPAGGFNGQVINIVITQGSPASDLTFGSAYQWIMGVVPTVSTGAGAVDLISGQYRRSTGKWLCSYLPDFTGSGTGSGSLPVGATGPAGADGATGPTGPGPDITALPAETSVDPEADLFWMYDASASAYKKVLGRYIQGFAADTILTADGEVLVDADGNVLVEE
jgi:hypothetical protein